VPLRIITRLCCLQKLFANHRYSSKPFLVGSLIRKPTALSNPLTTAALEIGRIPPDVFLTQRQHLSNLYHRSFAPQENFFGIRHRVMSRIEIELRL